MLRPNSVGEFVSVLPNLISWLTRRKKNVFFLEKEEERLNKILKGKSSKYSLISEKKVHKESDLIISLGGDGTLIGICRQANKKSPPVFGVNMGKLGFITEFSKAEYFDGLELLLSGKYEIEKVPLFEAQVVNKNGNITKAYFLNDVVFNKNDISRMFSLSVDCDDEHIYNISGDGLIVSSPIGSTAYSLAAGGPIIHPKVSSMVMTPICPHSLTHRPLVISDKSKISVKIPSKTDSLNITLDGQEVIAIYAKDIINITRSSTRYIKMVVNPDRNYFHTLKEKFTHGRG